MNGTPELKSSGEQAAFPTSFVLTEQKVGLRGPEILQKVVHMPGMDLLDWFAGQALIGLLAERNSDHKVVDMEAYRIAEEMMKTRKRNKDSYAH